MASRRTRIGIIMSAPASNDVPPELSIIVPTFREARNIPILVQRVFDALAAAGWRAEMIIIDDDSRDGTEAAVADLAQRYPVRVVTRRGERGLSSAVLRGFAEARADLLLVMDADLSHPPERVAAVAEAVRSGGADFSIGSRYVSGGTTADDWGFDRQLNSRVATWLARPLTRVRDPMAGFFCLRRDTWRRAESLNPIGYKIALELLVKCRCRNVVEVPIVFSDRLYGESKLTAKQRIEYLRHLAALYRFKFPWLLPLLIALSAAAVWWLSRAVSAD